VPAIFLSPKFLLFTNAIPSCFKNTTTMRQQRKTLSENGTLRGFN